MQLDTLVRHCQTFDDMGSAVQKQLADILSGEDVADQNPNALALIRDWLDGVSRRSKAYGDTELHYNCESLIGEIRAYLTAVRK